MKEKQNMSHLVTRFQTEGLDEAELQSKFANLQEILLRTQREHGERIMALASLETVQAELNRKRAKRFTP
jgi:hypothetical protein